MEHTYKKENGAEAGQAFGISDIVTQNVKAPSHAEERRKVRERTQILMPEMPVDPRKPPQSGRIY
jgi:hypothetical protein